MSRSLQMVSRLPRRSLLGLGVVLALALLGNTTLAAPDALSRLLEPAASPPPLVSYQGYVEVSGNPYSGAGYFKFAVVDAANGDGTANYWANDGTASGEPSTAVVLTVSNGLFDVMLGNTSLAGMTQSITADVFDPTDTYLRVWFSETASGPFQSLDPNQRIGSAPYALRAERAITADIAIGVGDNTSSCTSALAGNLRWTGSAYQVCDGFSWRTVQLSEGKVVLYQANNAFGITGVAIGGRSGADALCQSASNKPAGYSSYRAFISVTATDEIRDMPANYGVPTLYPVRSPNNTLIANNWADLLDGTISMPLSAAGVSVGGPVEWWSGSGATGALVTGMNCNAWTSFGGGTTGRFDSASSTWIYYSFQDCGSYAGNLLCIAY